MMLVLPTIYKENLLFGKLLPGEYFSRGIKDICSADVIIGDMDLRVTPIECKCSTKLWDGQGTRARWEFQLITGGSLAGIVQVSQDKKGRFIPKERCYC